MNAKKPKTVLLEFEDDTHQLFYIHSLMSVCETACFFHSENRMTHLNDYQHEIVAGSSMIDINNTLNLAKMLLKDFL